MTNQSPPTFFFNFDEPVFIDVVYMKNEIMVVLIDAADGTVKYTDPNSKEQL